MSEETIRCSDCGFINPAGSTSCWRCNYPLVPAVTGAPGPAAGETPVVPRMRPMRSRRPQPQQPLQLQLWLFFGALAALVVIFTAVRGFHETNFKPVEGAKPEQQKLADVLYDTGNWPEAIIHYSTAARLDSTRGATFVDMGVCYYNLGDAGRAEELFRTALRREPHLPQALFNLGIVHEQQQDLRGALGFYQQAIEAGPPEGMHQALNEAIARVNQKSAGASPGRP